MKIRRIVGVTLIGSLGFAVACGDDDMPADSPAGSGGSLERCGDGKCSGGETRTTCPADCALAGAGSGGKGGVSGRGGGAGSAGKGQNNESGEGGVRDGAAGGMDGAASGAAGEGASGGSGNTSGAAGAEETGGAAGAPEMPGALGAPCNADRDCAENLTCLTRDGLLDGSGPPNGLCTIACFSSYDCATIEGTSRCLLFSQTEAYCVEGCALGNVEGTKCSNRSDFACAFSDIVPDGTYCDAQTREGCAPDLVCANTGQCMATYEGCVYGCRGDFDCTPGFCDFTTGLCQPEDSNKLPTGSPCELHAPDEPDPCDGYCYPSLPNYTIGVCRAKCTRLRDDTGCGWNGEGPADSACLLRALEDGVGVGDVGLCIGLCDCNADCPVEGELCVDPNLPAFKSTFGRNGVCHALWDGETLEDTFPSCEVPAAGGAGGQSG
jgi:hypothetical protein